MINNPIEHIRAGIENCDWPHVCEGFFLLTGERLEPPDVRMSLAVSPEIFIKMSEDIEKVVRRHLQSKRKVAATAVEQKKSVAKKKKLSPEAESVIPVEDTVAHELVTAHRAQPPQPPQPTKADPFAQFRTPPAAPKREDGKQECRAEPFVPGMANTWKDTRDEAVAEMAESLALSRKAKPKDYRPEAKPVTVTCSKCNKDESVPAVMAPRKPTGSDDESSSYVCNGCIKRGKRG